MNPERLSENIALIKSLTHPLTPVTTGYPLRLRKLTVQTVIFDLYGTLLISAAGDVGPDSATDNQQALIHALADGGWDSDDISGQAAKVIQLLQDSIKHDQQKRREKGHVYPEIDIIQVWRKVLKTLQLFPKHDYQVKKLAVSYECRINPTWPMPGMFETIDGLKNMGIQLGIISNAQFYTPLIFRALTNSSLEDMGFDPAMILWSYQKLEGKPSPVLFEQLNSYLTNQGIVPGDVLFVGNDMIKDILPATQTGWKTALFAGDKRSLRLHKNDKQVADIQADLVIDDLRQLLRFLTLSI